MPIYEYRCQKCGKTFEHLAKSFSESVPKCPQCGVSNPKKQMSTFSHAGGSGGSDSLACPTGTCPTGTCSLG